MSAKRAEPEIINRLVPVAAITPHPENYQQHDENQVEDLRLSLREFGQVRSIVVQAQEGDGEAFLLVAGHGVHQAATLEKFKELRADVLPAEWPPGKVLAYLGADNELARRGLPDEAQLAAIVERVEAEAGAEMARLTAGGELQAAILKAQAGLAEALKQQLGETSQTGAWDGFDRGKRHQVVRPVLYVEDIGTFEKALRLTGKPHRGEAVMDILAFYLEHHG